MEKIFNEEGPYYKVTSLALSSYLQCLSKYQDSLFIYVSRLAPLPLNFPVIIDGQSISENSNLLVDSNDSSQLLCNFSIEPSMLLRLLQRLKFSEIEMRIFELKSRKILTRVLLFESMAWQDIFIEDYRLPSLFEAINIINDPLMPTTCEEYTTIKSIRSTDGKEELYLSSDVLPRVEPLVIRSDIPTFSSCPPSELVNYYTRSNYILGDSFDNSILNALPILWTKEEGLVALIEIKNFPFGCVQFFDSTGRLVASWVKQIQSDWCLYSAPKVSLDPKGEFLAI